MRTEANGSWIDKPQVARNSLGDGGVEWKEGFLLQWNCIPGYDNDILMYSEQCKAGPNANLTSVLLFTANKFWRCLHFKYSNVTTF